MPITIFFFVTRSGFTCTTKLINFTLFIRTEKVCEDSWFRFHTCIAVKSLMTKSISLNGITTVENPLKSRQNVNWS